MRRLRTRGARIYEESPAPGHPSGVRRKRVAVCWIERKDGGKQCAERTGDPRMPFIFVANRVCESIGWATAGACPTKSRGGRPRRDVYEQMPMFG